MQPGHKVIKALPDQLVLPAHKVIRVSRDPPVTMVLRGLKDQQVMMVPKDPLATTAPKDRQGLQEIRDLQVQPERQETMVRRDLPARKVIRDRKVQQARMGFRVRQDFYRREQLLVLLRIGMAVHGLPTAPIFTIMAET